MKIADLPVVDTPDGSETVVVLKGGVAKRASLLALVSAAITTTINALIAAAQATLDATVALAQAARGGAESARTASETARDVAQAAQLAAQKAGAALFPAISYGWLSVTTDAVGRVLRGVRLDGTAYDALDTHLYLSRAIAPVSSLNGDEAVELDAAGRVKEVIDGEGRRRAAFAGSFTPDTPGPMAYRDASDHLYQAGAAAKLAGGAANWTGGSALTFKAATVEGERIRVAAARGAAVEGWYYDRAGNAGFYDPSVVILLVSNGQSLSCGTRGRYFYSFQNTTALTSPRRLRIRMPRRAGVSDLRCGQWPEVGSANFAPVDPATILGHVGAYPQYTPALGETNPATFGETTLERMSKVVSDAWWKVTGRRQEMLLMSLGVGTASIDNLQKTAARPAPWPVPSFTWDANIFANQMARIARMRDLYAAEGKRLLLLSVDFTQGETGSSDAAWGTKFAQLVADFNADAKALTGQTWEPVWLMTQPSAIGGADGAQESQRAQIAQHVAGTAHLVQAQYPGMARNGYAPDAMSAADYVHKLAVGYALNGERSAQALLSICSQQQRPTVLRPLAVAAVANSGGTQWDVTFDVPVGPIVLDDAPGWTVPANYGIAYTDASGGAGVAAVAVLNASTLRISIDAAIGARGGRRFRFGENGPAAGGYSPSTMARTAIRDSATAISEVDGQLNRNWCLHSTLTF